MRLLLVEDDTMIGESVLDLLRDEGYAVDWVKDGDIALSVLETEQYDLILLDLGLPKCDGLTVLRTLRDRKSQTPVLVATARDAIAQRIEGLDTGADDYIVKPFSPRELLARLRALLRRTRPSEPVVAAVPAPDLEAGAHLYSFGPFTLDTSAWRLLREGLEVAVSSGEVALLRLFVEHPRRVLSRDHLVEWLKGYERGAFDRSIDVRVTRLRRKIESDPAHPVYIRTVRGEGYLFNPQGESA